MEKVLGIGGFFWRARDPKALGKWYETHFGINGEAVSMAQPVDKLDDQHALCCGAVASRLVDIDAQDPHANTRREACKAQSDTAKPDDEHGLAAKLYPAQ